MRAIWKPVCLSSLLTLFLLAVLGSVAPAAFASEEPVAAYSFDEGEGSTAHDASGNGNEGAVEGAEWTTGRYGGALDFDAEEGDVVTVPDSEGLDTEEFTLEAWIKPDKDNFYGPIIAHTPPEGSGYALFTGNQEEGFEGNLMGFISFHQWVNAHTFGEKAPVNRWGHVAVTNDGEELRLYLDGQLIDERESEPFTAEEAPLQIGGDEPFAEGNFFDGKIDEVRVYDRALDQAEIKEDRKTAIETPASPDPVAEYSFDEGEGSIAHDASGNGNEGEVEGATWTTGKYGGALDFDAEEGDVVTVPDSEGLDLEDFTLEAWIRPAEDNLYGPIVAHTAAEGYGYALYSGAGEEPFAGNLMGFISFHQWVNAHTFGEAPPVNAWSHVAVTSDGKEIKLYRNGTLIDERESEEFIADEAPLQIGGDEPFAEGNFFDGKIDEVRVYGRALSAEEVRDDKRMAIKTPPSQEPVAEYSFDEGAGETLHDDTGNGHEGAIEGAEWIGGKYGSALHFNGEGECVTVPDSEAFEMEGELTLEAWVRPDATRNWGAALSKEAPGELFDYGLFPANHAGVPAGIVADGTGGAELEAPGAEELPVGSWSHLALTSDGEELRLYVDGEEVDNEPTPAIPSREGPLQIGCATGYADFDGRIDEVRIYHRALEEDEISEDSEEGILGDFSVSIDSSHYRLLAVPSGWTGSPTSSLTYQWLRCDKEGAECEPIEEANQRRYAPGGPDYGNTLRVEVKAGSIASTRSAPTEEILEPAPAPRERQSPPLIYGHVAVGHLISDPSLEWQPTSSTVSFQWRRCDSEGEACEDIAAAAASQYLVQPADVGSTLRVAQTATTTGGSDIEVSEATEPVPTPALLNTTPPSISEDPGESGTELTADHGAWSGEGELIYTYEWERCDAEGAECQPVANEGRPTYRPTGKALGSSFRVRVIASSGSARAAALSASSAPFESSVMENVVAPSISGAPRAGRTLEGKLGTWTGAAPTESKLQWQRCNAAGEECAAISGATEAEYELTEADIGTRIRFQVSEENETGSSSVASAPTATVAAASGPAPSLLSAPEVSGGTEVGESLGATLGVWSGATEYGLQWLRCDDSGQECEPIEPLATEAEYELTEADVGSAVGVEVTAIAEDEAAASAVALAGQTVHVESAPVDTEAPSLEGSAEEGETLTSSDGSWAGPGPISYSYRWQRCDSEGCADISGATAATYLLTREDARHTVRSVVTAENASGSTTAVSARSASVGAASPLDETLPTISGTARSGGTLTAAHGTWNGDPTISYAYQWRRCDGAGQGCEDIEGAESSSYELAGPDVGSSIRVAVTASNGAGEEVAASEPVGPISATAGPTSTGLPAITGKPEAGAELSASNGEWEGAESFAYQWQRCDPEAGRADCANISGASSATYIPGYEDVGSSLRVAVTASGAGGKASAVSAGSETIEPNFAPGYEEGALANITWPSMSGEAEEGQTLTAHNGTWKSPWQISYSYRWRLCDAAGNGCVNIEGATSSTYVLQAGDVGGTVRAVISATVGSHSHVTITKPTAVVDRAKPANLSGPAIYGEPIEGMMYSTELGEWSGSELEFAYQWQRCDAEGKECVDIEEEAAEFETYWTLGEDIGSTIRVVVTASNESGSASAASTPSAIIGPALPENWVAPIVYGQEFQDGTLEAEVGYWGGTPELEFAYQWQRCDEEGEGCEAIEGAEAYEYVARAADVGHRLRVRVTANNTQGSAEATSPPSEVIGPPQLPVVEGPGPEIEGFPFDGRELEALPGQWGGHEPIEFAYQWQRCDEEGEGCEAIAGATEQSYLTLTADLGHRLRVKVTATNSSGSGSEISEQTEAIVEGPASSASQPQVSGEGIAGAELQAGPGQWFGSGPIEFAYQWQRCTHEIEECEDIEGATESKYVPGEEDVRHAVRVGVTATGPHGGEASYSEGLYVLPAPSESLSPPTITGTTMRGNTLTASTGEWSPEPDHYAYQWERCSIAGSGCTYISGATGEARELTEADVGHTIRVVVWAENEGEASPPSATSSATEIVAREWPKNVVPPSLGSPVSEQELTANPGTWVGPPPITFEYEWEHCTTLSPGSCSWISSASGATYVPPEKWVGQRLRVWVRGQNENGFERVVSALTEPIAEGSPSPPHNETPPTLLGLSVVGGEVQVDPGIWTNTMGWEYEWQRCNAGGEECAYIAQQRHSNYVPTKADLGHTLRADVSGWGGGFEPETVTTEPSEVVAAATEPVVEAAPTIEGIAEVGQTLISNEGEWGGSPLINFEYDWKRCDARGRHCEAIPYSGDEPQLEYRVADIDSGGTLRLQITAENGWGSVTATSAPTSVVPAPPALANLALPEVDGSPRYQSNSDVWPGEWTGVPSISRQWQRCDPLTEDPETEAMECVDIAEATEDIYHPQIQDVGYKLRLKETATAPGESQTAYSAPSSNPVSVRLSYPEPEVIGALAAGSTIKASSGIVPDAELPVETNYRFELMAPGGPEELQDGPSPELELTEADVGYWIRVSMAVSVLREDEALVVAAKETHVDTAVVDAVLANDAVPTFSGESVVGGSLSGQAGEWHGGGGGLNYAYQWRRCDAEGNSCANISGATAASYTPQGSDIGSTLRLSVTAGNGSVEQTAVSEPSGEVSAAVAPGSEGLPTISGEARELQTLESSPGTWSGSEVLTFSYQWQGCESTSVAGCQDIEGATESTLALDETVVGKWMRVVVTATNGGGHQAAGSELVGPVEAVPAPQPLTTPSLSVLGPPSVGSTLLTDGGNWEYAEPELLSYQWLRCEGEGECEAIDAPDTPTYGLREEDLGKRLEVEVTAANSSGEVSITSELGPEIGKSSGSLQGKVVTVGGGRQGLWVQSYPAIEEPPEEAPAEEEIANCETSTGHSNCAFYGPQISPNGKLIAVEERPPGALPGEGTIYLMDFDGSNLHSFGEGSQPQWSADGSEIYFAVPSSGAGEEGATELAVGRADGSNAAEPRLIPGPSGSAASPAISLSGDLMVYAGKEAGEESTTLYVSKPDGSSPRRLNLSPQVSSASDPVFSADGEEIIFDAVSPEPANALGIEFGLSRLWAVRPDGSGLHPLMQASSYTYGPPSVSAVGILASKQRVTYISAGPGGAFDYDEPEAMLLKGGGENPVSVSSNFGYEPNLYPAGASPLAIVNHYCKNQSPCGRFDSKRAAAYAEYWGNEQHSRNPYYEDFGSNNCTNFISQVIARGGMNYMRAYQHGDGSWWYSRYEWPPNHSYESDVYPDWTKSWVQADGLPRHLWQYGLATIDSNAPSDWSQGNILAEDWYDDGKGNFNHLQFVVGTTTSGGRSEPLIANSSSEGSNYSHLRWKTVKERIQNSEGPPGGKPGWQRVPLSVRRTVANLNSKVHDPDNLYGENGVFHE